MWSGGSIAVRCRLRVFSSTKKKKKKKKSQGKIVRERIGSVWVSGTTAASYEQLTNKEGKQRLQLCEKKNESQDDAMDIFSSSLT